jgi:hypothetical protein
MWTHNVSNAPRQPFQERTAAPTPTLASSTKVTRRVIHPPPKDILKPTPQKLNHGVSPDRIHTRCQPLYLHQNSVRKDSIAYDFQSLLHRRLTDEVGNMAKPSCHHIYATKMPLPGSNCPRTVSHRDAWSLMTYPSQGIVVRVQIHRMASDATCIRSAAAHGECLWSADDPPLKLSKLPYHWQSATTLSRRPPRRATRAQAGNLQLRTFASLPPRQRLASICWPSGDQFSSKT